MTYLKPSWRLLLALLLTFTIVGCDSNDGDDDDTGDDPTAIQDTWVSEGDDVAPGLAANTAFPTARIDATFRANGTYEVVATNPDDVSVTFSGTYETEATAYGDIREITLNQQTPSTVVAEGIYEIDGDVMTYEVIQVQPSVGALAPTAEDGFGSTSIGGTATGDIWIQTFRRVD